MKYMGKIISFLLVITTITAITGCTKSETNSDINSDTSIEIQAEMLSLKSADILMAEDFSEIICIDKNGTNNLIFGKLKSGKYSGYIANDEFTENKTFYFNPQEDETVKSAALASYGKSAVLTTIYNDTYIYIFGNNGELEKTLELGEVISPDDKFAEILCCEDGYYINIDRHTLAYIDSDGNYKGDVNTKGSNICGIVKDSNDATCVLLSNDNKMTLATLTKGKILEETNCDELADYTNAICTGKGDYRIVVIVNDGLFGLKNDKWVKLTDFAENDFNIFSVKDIEMINDKEFSAFVSKDGVNFELRLLTQRDISEIKPKEIVRAANVSIGYYDPYDELVKKYNSENDNYKVEFIDYCSDLYEDSVHLLNLDIIAGNAPDIVVFDDTAPIESYGNEDSIFVDMYKLIDNDNEINRSDFLDGFLEGLETKGKLLQITQSFGVHSFLIKDKFANGLTSWNIEDLEKIYTDNSDNLSFSTSSQYNTMADMLDELIFYCRFYDKESAECYYNSSEFINAMKFIKNNNIGISNDELSNIVSFGGESTEIPSFINDEVLLQKADISGFEYLRRYQQVYSNENATFIGLPSEEKINAISIPFKTYGIMANSDNVEGAWDFLKFYLFSEESFNSPINNPNFSGLEKYYTKQLEYFCKPHTYTDAETGEEKNSDIYVYFPENSSEMTTIELQPFNDDEAVKYDNFIRSALMHSVKVDNTIRNIVREEATAYFESERTAEDAAEIIQNRVSIYLSEQT